MSTNSNDSGIASLGHSDDTNFTNMEDEGHQLIECVSATDGKGAFMFNNLHFCSEIEQIGSSRLESAHDERPGHSTTGRAFCEGIVRDGSGPVHGTRSFFSRNAAIDETDDRDLCPDLGYSGPLIPAPEHLLDCEPNATANLSRTKLFLSGHYF